MLDISSWISGFVDGEGCFSVSFTKRAKLKRKIEVRCSFSVSQNRDSLRSLELIQKYFGCGGIRYSRRDRTYKYEVRDIKDLEVIINHFKKYELLTDKKEDYERFKKIYKKVRKSEHLSVKGLCEILEIAYRMNKSGKRKYKKEELLRLVTS